MTDPVVITGCPSCEARTKHCRDQSAETDPPAVKTDLICSKCGAIRTTKDVYDASQSNE